MTLKVIGAGFGRTGTMSTQKALEQLGFAPCYHMTEVVKNVDHVDVWEAAERGEPVDWHTFFAEYEAGVDIPVAFHYEALMDAFPDAKLILTTRDSQRWYDSFRNSIYELHHATPPRWFTWINPSFKRFIGWTQGLMWDRTFDGKFISEPDYAMRVFEAHNERVKAAVPADRLLIFSVKEGWEPLCTFLNVPIPDTPFPHANDRKQMQRMVQGFRILNILTPIVVIGLIGLVVWLLFQLL